VAEAIATNMAMPESTSAMVALVLAPCAARAATHAGSFSVSHWRASRNFCSSYRLCATRFFTTSTLSCSHSSRLFCVIT
jgi:hypothetical protein